LPFQLFTTFATVKILVIQTAFIGDVILATSALEKLHQFHPTAQLDILVRKGNESLFTGHPFLSNVLIWDKKKGKTKNLMALSKQVRQTRYDYIFNIHRFASSGFIVWRSKAKHKIGFDKNPFSFTYTKKVKHELKEGVHETDRINTLIEDISDGKTALPKLYPQQNDVDSVAKYQHQPYICIAPASVWFTKQWPNEKWVELCRKYPHKSIYLLGAPGDKQLCESIIQESGHTAAQNLAGALSFLQSAALMAKADMNYVNDSAPLHLASAMNAPVTAIFCSTIPAFGFGPVGGQGKVAQTHLPLDCRPCGLHGHKACPKGHFKCAEIHVE
jgi:heptosyltransferase II